MGGECRRQRSCPGAHGRENDSVELVVEVPKSEVALREEAMQAFWVEHDIFNKTLATPAGQEPKGEYVFYDGPPFATGLPHYGHILAGTIKDAIPRFWTMNGYRVRRQWGWDCHGLPVENLIEKKLGLATKRDIEEYGIKNFNEAARSSVMEYADDWEKIVPRMGRFVDMEHDYKTMDSTYTESVWWVFKALHDKGLVFEGFKSMHLCPRCGTTLSNFEVNLGYKDIKDLSVFVEFPLVDEPDTSFLAWTTTPWTLPGNMALAVNQDLEYVAMEVTTETGTKKLILAKDRVAAVLKDKEHKVVEVMKGVELLGKKYEPPFPWLREQLTEEAPKAWTVLHADFVELGEEGVGVVHIAPAYGEDDMKLGQEHGIPLVHHVDETGHFKEFVTNFAGRLVKPKDDEEAGVDHMDADIEIIRALAAKGRLFDKEKITHSYPHCWRCNTPLLNYATNSWFVNVPKIKDELVTANDKVNWVPDHVGTNRFGKWLEGARDWAVSRQRYWGAPLPIWRNPETKEFKVFGSLAELQQHAPKSGNEYFITRHAESTLNTKGILNVDATVENGITEKGKEQIAGLVAKLKERGIDYIYHSPLQRTRETAELVAEGLGLSKEAVVADDRLLEIRFGDFEGKTVDEYHHFLGDEYLTKRPNAGESWGDAKRRMGEVLYELDSKLKGKKVLIVSHNGPLKMLQSAADGDDAKETLSRIKDNSYDVKNAELRALPFLPMPHNDHYELDFHRPYIDEFAVYDNGVRLERVSDVFDCWFESGSMPYAQFHYPFACADTFEKENFPAQFIAEGLDQTRGWFYSMLVLGVALFGKSPYEQVIVNGLVLAEDGKKMSKSLQNYPDPMELANRVGVDAMRYYLLSSPVIRGEDLSFSEKEVLELQRKNVGRLHNVLAMYEMFQDGTKASDDSDHVLDRWIIARLNQLVAESTAGYKGYELDKATRPITDFIDDLSVWYLRRSRERLKGEDTEDKQRALATLRYTLRTLALVMAPVMPFYAEYLWQQVKEEGDAESVHLGKWPESKPTDLVVVGEMSLVREFVTLALEARTKANIKVRQPLAALSLSIEMAPEYAVVIADEVNVKEVRYASEQSERAVLDTTLTPELIAEGAVRELMRAVQERRKAAGLAPQDAVVLTVDTNEAGQAAIKAHEELLTKTVGASELLFAPTEGELLAVGEYTFTFSIEKL
jgi:isoleucyl-tRNA synthetase